MVCDWTRSDHRLTMSEKRCTFVAAGPRSSDPDQILKSLHWLKVQERIEYKIISTTYKVLQSSSPHYLRDIITIHPSRSTRLSFTHKLSRVSKSVLRLIFPAVCCLYIICLSLSVF